MLSVEERERRITEFLDRKFKELDMEDDVPSVRIGPN